MKILCKKSLIPPRVKQSVRTLGRMISSHRLGQTDGPDFVVEFGDGVLQDDDGGVEALGVGLVLVLGVDDGPLGGVVGHVVLARVAQADKEVLRRVLPRLAPASRIVRSVS